MKDSPRLSELPLIDSKRMYIQLVEKSWFWVTINNIDLVYKLIDFDSVNSILILKDLNGSSTHGNVWLVCTPSGQVFVLKYAIYSKNGSYDFLKKESMNWNYFGIKTKVSIWNNRKALMMPFFLTATDQDWKDFNFIKLVKQLIYDLAEKNLCHKDLHKRHVGKYIKDNKLNVVFFDLSTFESNVNQDKDSIIKEMQDKLSLENY